MATTNQTFVPLVAVHPTELIKDEMRERGLKRNELAKRMGMQLPNLSRLLNKKEAITSHIAHKLELALGIDAEMWLNLQAAYDRDLALISERDIQEKEYASIEKVLSSIINVSLLFKQLAIDTYSFAQDRIKKLYSIFNVDSTDALIALTAPTGQFKRSDRLATDDKNLSTWVLLAHKECVTQTLAPTYSEGNAVAAAEAIAKKANMGEVTEASIEEVLNSYGIGYGYVQKIDKAPIDAYSTIINGIPYIVTSHRRNNMDMLVFDVLHELKHIHTDLQNGNSNLSCNGEYNRTDEKELAADKFAEDMLISPDIWQKILKAKSRTLNPYHVFAAVIKEAKSNGISASIAAWRYKHETGCYAITGYKSPGIK